MMEDRLGDMSLSGDEGEDLNMEAGVEGTHVNLDLNLVGRILTDKTVNFNAMRHCFASIWRPMGEMNITVINRQLFLFQFFHLVDLKRVFEGP